MKKVLLPRRLVGAYQLNKQVLAAPIVAKLEVFLSSDYL